MTTVATDLAPALVGTAVGPLDVTVEARWLMAYAAAIGEEAAVYFDGAGDPVPHPVFPVAYEWPAVVALRGRILADDVQRRGVHLTHSLVLHRLPRAGERLAVQARVVGVQARRAGALVAIGLDAFDAAGAPVTSTVHGSLYRGVNPPADAGQVGDARDDGPAAVRWTVPVDVARSAAHVYTECARIWNPIHTDSAVARAAGLPGPILHGTATLAMAVSRVVARDLDGDPTRVGRVDARFTGMVVPPCTIEVRAHPRRDGAIGFEVHDAQGRPVLSGGAVWPR